MPTAEDVRVSACHRAARRSLLKVITKLTAVITVTKNVWCLIVFVINSVSVVSDPVSVVNDPVSVGNDPMFEATRDFDLVPVETFDEIP